MNIQEISVENLVISPFNVRQLPSNDDKIKGVYFYSLYIFIVCIFL